MNILVVNGSPKGKNSNTMYLTNAFLEGLQEKEACTVEIAELKSMNIHSCTGCYACWHDPDGKCVQKDDMQELLPKFLWADLIVYSFPLYNFTVTALLKSVLERRLPLMTPFMKDRTDGIGNGSHGHRYPMDDKKYVVISTCGFYTSEGNYDAVDKMFAHVCGSNGYTSIYCGQGELFHIPELSDRTNTYLSYVRQAGREYYDGGITNDTRAHLQELLYPKSVFEKMADANWGIDKETGKREDPALSFTRQMIALYNPENYDGTDRILVMHYTDIDKSYKIRLTKDGSEIVDEPYAPYTTMIETPISVWKDIAAKKISGAEALGQGLYTVRGDMQFLMNWDRYFGATIKKETPEKKASAVNTAIPDAVKHNSLVFTQSMAALYNKEHYPGKDIVIEMHYTDEDTHYKIRLTKDGSEVLEKSDIPYTTLIETPLSVWTDIAEGKISGPEAMAQHLYRVKGDFNLMMQWDELFGEDTGETAVKDDRKPPKMSTMLLAWMSLWMGCPVGQYGAFIPIAACALLTAVRHKHIKTLYDSLSLACVPILAIMALVLHNSTLSSSIGYLIFGLMWLLSCVKPITNVPLCAEYVKYEFGPEAALKNPVFLDTNRIIAAVWGVMYVILAPVAYLMFRHGIIVPTIVLCNVLPVFGGIFTAWFKDFYPKYQAAGGKTAN